MALLRRFWLAVLLAAVFGVAAPAATAQAQGNDDNVAEAINQRDGSTEIDVEFDLEQVLDGIVDQTNAAIAYSNCQECQTIAIAIQIVLVNSPVEMLKPQNLALAINEDCLTCVTVAIAYQFVIGRPERLEFTKEARKRLKRIARALRRLEHSDGTAQEVVDEVNRIMIDLSDVLATGLRPAGPLHDPGREEDGVEQQAEPPPEDAAGQAAPSPTPEPQVTPTPEDATPQPTPEPSETPTPTPAPTETPEPAPTPTPSPVP